MPATPVERLRNPLRQLRVILGEFAQPLSQHEFAKRTGLSFATVVGIENGRRPISAQCAMQIFITLFASWNNQDQHWHFLGTEVLYEKKHADLASAFDPEDPYVDDYEIHRLLERILTMFEACPTRQDRRGLLLYLSGHLKDKAADFGINADLRPTEPIWGEVKNPKPWGKALGKEAVFWAVYPHAKDAISPHQDAGGIFDFRSHRTFRAEDYPEGKTPDEQGETVHKRTADKATRAGKKEILTGPIPHPNTEKEKLAPKERVLRQP